MYGGEDYDATLEQTGWINPGSMPLVGSAVVSVSTNRQTETPDSSSRQGDGKFSVKTANPVGGAICRIWTEFVGLR